MFDREKLEEIARQREKWEKGTLKQTLDKWGFKREDVAKQVYTPLDIERHDYGQDLGFPGEYPYTRGHQPTAVPGTIGLDDRIRYSGYGTPEDTREHYKYLVTRGFSAPSIAFDLPTQLGYDSDYPLAEGEVGKAGVAVDTLRDMEVIFEAFKDIPFDWMRPNFTINAPTAVILSMYITLAERQGVLPNRLHGTTQNDILKEYTVRGNYIFPPEPSLRLIADTIVYCSHNMPRWNVMSICGYHYAEAGANGPQELAFMFSDAIAYAEVAIEAGLEPDEFLPRFGFLGGCGPHFFREIAKFRAARRIWAKIVKQRFKANNPASYLLRMPVGNARYTFTRQKPLNNIVRGAYQGMASLLGGTMGGGNSTPYDEALGLFTETSRRVADDTPRILILEGKMGEVLDPLGGSYYVEALTNEIEQETWNIIKKVDSLGGAVKAIEKGFMQQEIARSAYQYQKEVESGERIIVGVNKYQVEEEEEIKAMEFDPTVEEHQFKNLAKVRKERNNRLVKSTLEQVRKAAEGRENIMPPTLEAVKAYATIGEIYGVLREVFGEYVAPGFI